MKKINYKLILEILVIVIFSLSFLFLFACYVPFNMDTFGQYHALMCAHYPLNKLNKFTEGCGSYDLAPIANYYLPLRSYSYLGSFPCVLYYPLFRLWPSPYSARLLGFIILAIQAFFIRKLFKIDLLVSFLILLSCMPYAFQHIVDFGAVCFQTTSVFFICYLGEKWALSLKNNATYSWIYPFFAGITIFIGIWTKLSYFVVLPGSIVLFFYYLIAQREISTSLCRVRYKEFVKGVLILFSVAATPTFILFNSFSIEHQKYYVFLAKSASKLHLTLNWGLTKYFFNPLLTADRIFEIADDKITISGLLLAIIILGLLFFGIRQLWIKKIKYGFAVLNILLFLLAFFFIAMHPKSLRMHHVVLSLPFLILALCYICSKLNKNRLIFVLLVVFCIVNLNLYRTLTKLKPQEENHPSLLRINQLLNKQYANQYVFVVIDWGMYYIKALYGEKNQCVLYIRPFNRSQQVAAVKKILNKLKRKALFIGRVDSHSSLSLIKQHFPDIIELQTNFDTGHWRIWYEP